MTISASSEFTKTQLPAVRTPRTGICWIEKGLLKKSESRGRFVAENTRVCSRRFEIRVLISRKAFIRMFGSKRIIVRGIDVTQWVGQQS